MIDPNLIETIVIRTTAIAILTAGMGVVRDRIKETKNGNQANKTN